MSSRRTATAKGVPRKVGLAPVRRDGLEYEFDIMGDLSLDHELVIGKTGAALLKDAVISHPGAELAQTLRGWLDGPSPRRRPRTGSVVVRDPPAGRSPPPQQRPRRGLLEVMRADLQTCATSAQVQAVYKRAEAAIDASDKPPRQGDPARRRAAWRESARTRSCWARSQRSGGRRRSPAGARQ